MEILSRTCNDLILVTKTTFLLKHYYTNNYYDQYVYFFFSVPLFQYVK